MRRGEHWRSVVVDDHVDRLLLWGEVGIPHIDRRHIVCVHHQVRRLSRRDVDSQPVVIGLIRRWRE